MDCSRCVVVDGEIILKEAEAAKWLVAGFNKRHDRFGRNVKKGEKGINIIAPSPYKKKIEETKPNPDTPLPMLDDNGNEVKAEKEIQIRSIDFVGIIPPSGSLCRSRVY